MCRYRGMGNSLPTPAQRPFFLIERILDTGITVGVINGQAPQRDVTKEEIRLQNQGLRIGSWENPIYRLKAFEKKPGELNYTFDGNVKLKLYKCSQGTCYDLSEPMMTTSSVLSIPYKPCSMGDVSKELDEIAGFFEANARN